MMILAPTYKLSSEVHFLFIEFVTSCLCVRCLLLSIRTAEIVTCYIFVTVLVMYLVSSQNAVDFNIVSDEQTELVADDYPQPNCGRKGSDVWNLFTKIEVIVDGVTNLKAKCTICGDALARGGTTGTSHLHDTKLCTKQQVRKLKILGIKIQMLIGLSSSGRWQIF